MILERIVGSIVIESGPQPFALYTQTGKFEVGNFVGPDEAQKELSVIQQQRFVQLIAERAGVSFAQVRLGQYYEESSRRWVNILVEEWDQNGRSKADADQAPVTDPAPQEPPDGVAPAEEAIDRDPDVAALGEEDLDAESTPDVGLEEADDAEPELPPKPAAWEEELDRVALGHEVEEEMALREAAGQGLAEEVVVDEVEVEEGEEEEFDFEDEVVFGDVPEDDEEEEDDTLEKAGMAEDDDGMLENAIHIAVEAHRGQVDKAGAPYILHPLRLMMRMQTPLERIAAVLHDVVEDSGWTLDELRREGFSDEVIDAVDGLTRRDGETYEAFIERAAQHPVARRVKLADLEDNMDMRRLAQPLTYKDESRLFRYHKAWLQLKKQEAGLDAAT